jgi:RIO kinase 1
MQGENCRVAFFIPGAVRLCPLLFHRELMNHQINPDSFLDDEIELAISNKHVNRSSRVMKHGKLNRVKFLADAAEHAAKVQVDLSQTFVPTFSPSEHERLWTLSFMEEFYNNGVITDVLRKDKGGKEANVYCCTAHPATGLDLLAAKLYRPRMFRNLRNDALYRQGRVVKDAGGKVASGRRENLAITKNTRFGKELRHTSWLEYEYQTLQMLHEAGADVPKPLTHGNNVIMMEYIGDRDIPAPTLNQVTLGRSEARALFNRLVENIATMLACHRVHADLSAYNVLYWEGRAIIIDFPQAVDPRRNPDACPLFIRDVERICQYFSRYGIAPNPLALANELWGKYQRTNALDAGYDLIELEDR